MIDPANIGTNKQFKSTQEAADANCGRYRDNTEGLTEEQRFPMLPRGTDPQPLKNAHTVGK